MKANSQKQRCLALRYFILLSLYHDKAAEALCWTHGWHHDGMAEAVEVMSEFGYFSDDGAEPELNFCIRAGAGFRNLVGVGVLITIVCSQSDKDFETRQKHLFRLEI